MPNKHKEKKQRVATQAEIDREDTVNNIVETCIQQIDVIATYAATDLRNSMLTNVASDAIEIKIVVLGRLMLRVLFQVFKNRMVSYI